MKTVFILHHSYERDGCEETKLIGVYSTKKEAELAINRLKDKNGFKYRPDAFEISKYKINQDNWIEGFASVTTINIKNKDNKWIAVDAECLPNNQYQILEFYNNKSLGEFKNLDIVECEEKDNSLYAVRLVSKSSN